MPTASQLVQERMPVSRRRVDDRDRNENSAAAITAAAALPNRLMDCTVASLTPKSEVPILRSGRAQRPSSLSTRRKIGGPLHLLIQTL
jgi:hypothetical protein